MSATHTMNFFERLRHARLWVFLQYVLRLVLLAVGLAWTRLPDKSLWQVALTLLVPVLLLVCVLELDAATMRKLADDDGQRVKLITGALAMLPWICIWIVGWLVLDWCDDHIPLCAGYFNSKFGAHARASVMTYPHIVSLLTACEWVLRWIALPAKLAPFAAASAQWGVRLPWRRVMRLLWNWQWWLGVIVAALIGVWLPSHLFTALPKGTVSAQVWHVGIKVAGAYLLAVSSWVFVLAWWATNFASRRELPPDEELVGAYVPARPSGNLHSESLTLPPSEIDLDS